MSIKSILLGLFIFCCLSTGAVALVNQVQAVSVTPAGFVLSASTTTITAGQSISITLTARDGSGVTDPTYTGTVHFDSVPGVSVPADYTFTAADAGVHTFTNIVFNTVGTYTLNLSDSLDTNMNGTFTIIVNPSPTPTATPSITETSATPSVSPTPVSDIVIDNVRVSNGNDTVTVCWETNEPTTGYVQYGETQPYTRQTAPDPAPTTTHCHSLTGLPPGSTYGFTIISGNDGVNQNYRGNFRTTAPNTDKPCNVTPGTTAISGSTITVPFSSDYGSNCSVSFSNTQGLFNHYGIISGSNRNFSALIETVGLSGPYVYYHLQCTSGSNFCSAEGRLANPSNIPQQQVMTFNLPLTIYSRLLAFIGLVILLLTILPIYPTFWFRGIAWIFSSKKRNPWGLVYDQKTRKPIPFTVVRLFDLQGNLLKETVTDLQGRYDFMLDPGIYTLEVQNSDYQKYSRQITIARKDAQFTNDIALASLDTRTLISTDTKDKFLSFFFGMFWVIGFIGMGFSVVALILNPDWINVGIVLVYVFQFTIMVLIRPLRNFGFVYETKDGTRLPGVFIRVYDTDQERQLDAQLTDSRGRFGFKLEQGNYILRSEKPSYTLVEAPLPIVTLADGTKAVKAEVNQLRNVKLGMTH